jgi:hypothetical protein
MYSRTPTEEELAGTGFTVADYADDEPVEIWPENMRAINLFNTLSTQWIVGASGASGLNYVPLFHRMDRMNLGEQEYEWLFDDIRTIEAEALTAMNKKD